MWSDPRVIELAKEFVAATDEVWRLQRGTDAECAFFQKMAEHGHYGGRPGATRQGIYVCAASGKFLASVNSNSADRVLAVMRRGLRAWQELPDHERRLAPDATIKPQHRWEESYPVEGLVLTMFTRDLPAQGGPNQPCASPWNQDRVWFSKAEARMWLPKQITQGATHQLPKPLCSRLIRFHLVDTVKGQTSPFSNRDVKESNVGVEVTQLAESLAKIKITGVTRAETSRRGRRTSPHGVATRLLGQATYDLKKDRFTQFEIVALGKRKGYTTYNGRRRDAAESPVGYVFRLASPEEPRIAPAFVPSYNADWVVQPHPNRRARPFNPTALFNRRDANKDGKLTGEEISERMRDRLESFDADGDGAITKKEFDDGIRRIFRRDRNP